ncbi:S-adenosyl-L-methionine-dependent methyltransferase [Massariosphaeria phaeospora]|uniref:S-adenosyl-L-methionine-dependent methyltransferase n=1 Tax=Massariosphaeria phaeospora TaxID=100035 RepID=A0A7C8HZR9_9PLEO|nr:S-adenosyl-L-methionine-dependent methyltransferase [Massariosphaeria phaeospora]
MASSRQADNAIKFYGGKSHSYDDTWHVDFTKRFISYLDIEQGQHVLDLACGTGLLTLLEADAVGAAGRVVGVDVTPDMLVIAASKKRKESERYANVQLCEGDILDLEAVEGVRGQMFDIITVASALVLLPDPVAAIKHWSSYLNPGGIIALDSTHPRNLVSGMVFERTARRLGLSAPYNREWSQSEESLKEVLEAAGFAVEKVITVDYQAGYGKRYYEISDWEDFFVENVIMKDVSQTFANREIRPKAQQIFKEEWEKLAEGGRIEEVDVVFLGVARKPPEGSSSFMGNKARVAEAAKAEILFTGGCRCGGVRYASTATPTDITFCHCRACQQLSGSAFLPFVEVPTPSLKFTSSSSLTTLKLSNKADRTFCSGCGTPVTMVYHSDSENTSLTRASMDEESFKCEKPKFERHIFLDERVSWPVLPEQSGEK